MYELRLQPETPVFLAPGARRAEVRERITATGEVLIPLDEVSLHAAVERLIAQDVQAIAVCFLFSFLYPEHERRARDYIRQRYPDIAVSLSSEVDPGFREYERTCVTAFDAYVKPVVDRYLQRMEDSLAAAGIGAPLQVMQSRGGLAAATVARQRPVRLFLSGPAAGVIGAQAAGRAAGFASLITCDVGGTSCDIALINDGEALVRHDSEIAGYPVRVPMVDINTLGAGGGSIAWLDPAGGLRVGPHSAGADPGPACYGRGGTDATVTDASLVLGYLDPAYFAGGSLSLDREKAIAAVEQTIAKPMGLSVEQAALGIHRIVNAQMAEGIRLVSIKRGFDPREFTLVALGGAGPLHAVPLAMELDIGRVLVPRHPGLLSAAGLLAAPVEHEVAAAFGRPLAGLEVNEIRQALDELDQRADQLMAAEQLRTDSIERRHCADVCYIGQSYTLEVELDLTAADAIARMYEDFLAVHERVHGHATRSPAQIVNLRSVHRAATGHELPATEETNDLPATPAKRMIRIAGSEGSLDAAVYRRRDLAIDQIQIIKGPAIIEQDDTTTLLPPGWNAKVIASGSLLLEPE
jgi:N-methylhydantoinase A/oxoprolinase/acetone carboxylase beta subunit